MRGMYPLAQTGQLISCDPGPRTTTSHPKAAREGGGVSRPDWRLSLGMTVRQHHRVPVGCPAFPAPSAGRALQSHPVGPRPGGFNKTSMCLTSATLQTARTRPTLSATPSARPDRRLNELAGQSSARCGLSEGGRLGERGTGLDCRVGAARGGVHRVVRRGGGSGALGRDARSGGVERDALGMRSLARRGLAGRGVVEVAGVAVASGGETRSVGMARLGPRWAVGEGCGRLAGGSGRTRVVGAGERRLGLTLGCRGGLRGRGLSGGGLSGRRTG